MENKDKVEIVKGLVQIHQQWLSQPTTKGLVTAIERHKASFVAEMAKNSVDVQISNEMFRCYSYGIRTCDAILKLVTDSNAFVTATTK